MRCPLHSVADFKDLTESPPPEPTHSNQSTGIFVNGMSSLYTQQMSASPSLSVPHQQAAAQHTQSQHSQSGKQTHTPRSNMSLLLTKPMMAMLDVDDTDTTHRELAERILDYDARVVELEEQVRGLQDSLDEMVHKFEDQETEIQSLRDKNKKWKKKEFDWMAKEKEYKALISQYNEIRESNAKLTLTYWTLQCQYDKLKRDYDRCSSTVLQYGDYQIPLANQLLMTQLDNSSTTSSTRNLLLSNNNSNSLHSDIISSNNIGDQFQFSGNTLSPTNGLSGMDMDIMSEDDEVDMVVGFMSSTAQRSSQVMQVNDVEMSTSPTSVGGGSTVSRNTSHLNVLGHLSNASQMSHGYNASFLGNQKAFQLSGKNKDELIEEVLRLHDRIDEITDTKFRILQSSEGEIRRLDAKVKILEEAYQSARSMAAAGNGGGVAEMQNINEMIQMNEIKEIQLDQEMSRSENVHKKSRASFGGGIIGLPFNEDHTYNVSKNDLDTVARQLINPEKHSRAQTMNMVNLQYLVPTHSTRSLESGRSQSVRSLSTQQTEQSTDSDDRGSASKDVTPEEFGKHQKQLTFLEDISEQSEEQDFDDAEEEEHDNDVENGLDPDDLGHNEQGDKPDPND